MQQNEQHEIDTLAMRLFQYVLPANLIVRGQEQGKDYGIDAEVELFKDRQSTGKIFKTQIKGTKHPKYIDNGKFISLSFDLDRAEYLIDQIEIPTAMILCDITKNLVFWNVLHIDQSLHKVYKLGKEQAQKTITVHFETCNRLPNTLEQLLVALSKAGDILALARAANINLQAYSEIDSEFLRQRINITLEKLERLSNIQQNIRDLARKEGRWKVGKHFPIDELESIAAGMLKSNERIEAKVAGSYTIESSFGSYEIVKGFMVATNQRVLVVLNAPMQTIRKDSFTYSQINGISMISDEMTMSPQIITASTTSDKNSISLIVQGEVITLYDVIDDCNDPENFKKYITEKKTPPPKTTIAARNIEIVLPPQKLIKVQQNFFHRLWEYFF